jgi:hypothetical protein
MPNRMPKRSIWTLLPMALIFCTAVSPVLRAQTAPANSGATNSASPKSVDSIPIDKWNSVPLHGPQYNGVKSAPALAHDLSGVWDATGDPGPGGPPPGIQPSGAFEHKAVLPDSNSPPGGEPDERKIPNPLPYTPLGESTLEAHKPTGLSIRSVPATEGNDPVDICDPPGFPRMDLSEFRTLEIIQADDKVLILNQFFRTWRTIWTDGRELPKDPEPRFYGYSVGKWVDDYTFVVQTVGMADRTWIDNAGRPHSADLKVEERYHRVDQDHIELTLTIDDPKMYTKPWLALNKFPLRRQPHGFDIREMYCAPSDYLDYNGTVGNSLDAPAAK